ncbi:hypothetical protein F4678DRAFT_267204 [Xylaria arbuscula]|nr:hypothetical protein F4678DRAFT_267204 [Xylaria arbuscula]
MYFTRTTAVLALVPLAFATECTQSNAIDWPSISSGSGSGSGSGDPCADYCGNDAACLQACYEEAEQGQCNAVGCSEKRSTFTCASDETCFRYTDGSLLCLNTKTNEYTDDVGGHGNAESGVYTSANGLVTTNLGDSAATTTAKAATTTAEAATTSTEATTTTTEAATTTNDNQGAQSTSTTLHTVTASDGTTSAGTPTVVATPTKTGGAEGRPINIWAIGISSLFIAFIKNTMY